MIRIDFKFDNITPEEARRMQYKLATNLAVYRVFLNGYSKNGYITFDESKLSREEVLQMLEEFKPEIIRERTLTPDELIIESLSWKNTAAA
ncbi:MAG: DUF3213 domain-containing protein [Thermococcus sp.]|uniref:DUF3213 domain-containing protein n=1 Tax=Thermococcus sp. TaxID=35749 RepID=UPI002630C454|nr:DUF3213 domain-containing protein [Thermococcus sp.]MCD6140264.1 DUF3213 domain-containing protein [Thermococcus sp.]MCD6142948.1 DUF3213 domain-containing protein [Thermococcus sp.]